MRKGKDALHIKTSVAQYGKNRADNKKDERTLRSGLLRLLAAGTENRPFEKKDEIQNRDHHHEVGENPLAE